MCCFTTSSLHVFDARLSLLRSVSVEGKAVFSANIGHKMLAFASGPELSVFDLERGKMLFGQPEAPEPPEVPEAPKWRKEEPPPPAVASEKYVRAARDDADEPGLEMGRLERKRR